MSKHPANKGSGNKSSSQKLLLHLEIVFFKSSVVIDLNVLSSVPEK